MVREQYDRSRLVDGVLNVKFLDKVDVLNVNEKVVVAVWRMINRISWWVAENLRISKRTSIRTLLAICVGSVLVVWTKRSSLFLPLFTADSTPTERR